MSGCSGCAIVVFRKMDHNSLVALKVAAQAAQGALSALKVKSQAMSASLAIDLAPLLVKKASLDAIIDEAKKAVKIIPAEYVAECPDLGRVNGALESALFGQLEHIQNLTFDINQLNAAKLLVDAQTLKIDVGISFFDQLVGCINEVLGGG